MASYNNNLNSPLKVEIETLFNKILSPIKKDADPNLISLFCQKLNIDLDNSQFVIDLVIQKLQSSFQEWELLVTLKVLEACVKNCGEDFHDLIGRFRFLNEIIKLISPKYSGNRTSHNVKKKCIELLFSWSRGLSNNQKIKEAYEMLKKQGIINHDPKDIEELVIKVEPRNRGSIFEDEENSKILKRLLKSRNPQDLELANKIIKNMVKQDEIKIEKKSNTILELEKVNQNINLLNEMLAQFEKNNSNNSETETIKFLYEELQKMKPNLIKLAAETDDNDEHIGNIIHANDLCESTFKKYRRIIEEKYEIDYTNDDETLVNISSNDDESKNKSLKNTDSNLNDTKKYDSLNDLKDLFTNDSSKNQLLNLKKNIDLNSLSNVQLVNGNLKSNYSDNMITLIPSSSEMDLPNRNNFSIEPETKRNLQLKGIDELADLGKYLMENSLNSINLKQDILDYSNQIKDKDINELNNSFEKLFIELKSIKPALSISPINLFAKNNLKMVLHFGENQPLNDVYVFVISTTSYNLNYELKNFIFQAAVTKNLKLKLQPASKNCLPIYNPILPLDAITQIMTIANPYKENIRLKFKLTYTYGDTDFVEKDEIVTILIKDLIFKENDQLF